MLLLLPLIFCECANNSLPQKFEGTLTYTVINYSKDTLRNPTQRTLQVYLKEGKELEVYQSGSLTIKTYSDKNWNTSETYLFTPTNRIKIKHTDNFDKAFIPEIKLQDSVKNIMGYQCKYAKLSEVDPDGIKCVQEIYYTDKLPKSLYKDWKVLSGFPLQYTLLNDDGTKSVSTIKSISEKPLPDSVFNEPTECALMTWDELKNGVK